MCVGCLMWVCLLVLVCLIDVGCLMWVCLLVLVCLIDLGVY